MAHRGPELIKGRTEDLIFRFRKTYTAVIYNKRPARV